MSTNDATSRPASSHIPVQLLCPANNLLLISRASLWRGLPLALVGEVCGLHLHRSMWPRHPQPEIGIVQHLHCEIDGFRSEVYHQSFALEFPIIIQVHLDTLSTTVDFLGDDTTFGESVSNLFEIGIEGDRRNVDGCIHALFLGFLYIVL